MGLISKLGAGRAQTGTDQAAVLWHHLEDTGGPVHRTSALPAALCLKQQEPARSGGWRPCGAVNSSTLCRKEGTLRKVGKQAAGLLGSKAPHLPLLVCLPSLLSPPWPLFCSSAALCPCLPPGLRNSNSICLERFGPLFLSPIRPHVSGQLLIGAFLSGHSLCYLCFLQGTHPSLPSSCQ